MLNILIFIMMPLSILSICAQMFEMLPSKIFLDFDENERIFVMPYIMKNSNYCIACLGFLLAFFVAMSTQFCCLSSHFPLQIVQNIIISILLGHIFISDFLFQIIPGEHLLLLLIANLGNFSMASLAGGLLGFLPFFSLSLLFYLLLGTLPVGFGDIKLLSVLGMLAGPTAILAVQVLACTLSGIFCAAIVLSNSLHKMKKDKADITLYGFVPLAPFIIFAFGIIVGLMPKAYLYNIF